MLDLVETVFSRYGIRNLRYDGSMNRAARDFVLAQFRKPEGPQVICIRCDFQLFQTCNSFSYVGIARSAVALV